MNIYNWLFWMTLSGFYLDISYSLKSPNTIERQMVMDYFQFKNARSICVLSCWHKKDLILLAKMAARQNFNILTFNIHKDINKANYLDACLMRHTGKTGVLLDLNCQNVISILKESSVKKQFDNIHTWLLLTETTEVLNTRQQDKPNSIYLKVLENINLHIDSEVTLAVQYLDGIFKLYDVFNFGQEQGGSLNVTGLGKWKKGSGLSVWLNDYKYNRRWDFHGLELRAVAVFLMKGELFKPEMLTSPGYVPGVNMLTKLASSMLDLMRQQHNFTLKYVVVDRWVGPRDNTTNTQSLARTLAQNKADVCSTGLRLFSDRLTWFDALLPHVTYIESRLYYRIPDVVVGNYDNEFARPFASSSWAVIACAACVCVLALRLTAQAERRNEMTQYAFFTTVSIICQQLFDDGPQPIRTTKHQKKISNSEPSLGRRLVVMVTCLSSLLLYNYYTSSIVSFLLSTPLPTIDTFQQMIQSPLELIFEDIGYTRSWIDATPGLYMSEKQDPAEYALRDKKVTYKGRKMPVYVPVNEGIELVRKGGYAYHTEPYTAQMQISATFTQEEICDLASFGLMDSVPVYMVAAYKSPYSEFFKWSLLRIASRGHLHRTKHRISAPLLTCSQSSAKRAVSLGGAAPAFLLLAILGWIGGAAVLGCEVLWYR